MNLAYHPLALGAWDKVRLHGSGVLGWRKGAGEERAEFMVAHPVKIGPSNYGKARAVALRFVAGEFSPNLTHEMIAESAGVTLSAFRTQLYSLAREKE